MAPLKLAAAILSIGIALPVHAETVGTWRPFITEASVRCGIPTRWIERVMQAESNGQTSMNGRPIRSRAGAIGLMQLMPSTWQIMRRSLGLGADPDDPRDNILAGTCYLRSMYDRFGYPGLFSAYNAGPGRYADHIATGRPLPQETVAYLGAVRGRVLAPTNVRSEPPSERLFVVRREQRPEGRAVGQDSSVASLFVMRRDGF